MIYIKQFLVSHAKINIFFRLVGKKYQYHSTDNAINIQTMAKHRRKMPSLSERLAGDHHLQ